MKTGDRVILTKHGQKMFPKPPFTGTVIREAYPVLHVRQDGRRTVDGWSPSWWKKIPKGRRA